MFISLGLGEDHREEHDDRGQGGRGDGGRDLARADTRGRAPAEPFLLVPVDVLHHDDRVVDEHADADDQTEQRQRVHRLAHRPDHAAGDDEREGDAGHGDRRQAVPSEEEEEHEAGEDRAEDAREGQFAKRLADLLALVEPDQERDALELGVGVHLGDLRLDGVADLDGIRSRLGRDGDADSEVPVEVASVLERRLLVGHVGDVGEAEAVGSERRVPDLLDRFEAADRPDAGAAPVGTNHPGGEVEVARGENPRDLAQIDPVRLEVGEPQVDPHFLRVDPVEVDRRDAVDPLERPDDLPLEKVVALGQVARGRKAGLEDRRVVLARVPRAADGDVPDRVRQLAADPVEALENLGAREAHLVAPLELEANAPALGVRAGVDRLDPLDRPEGFLDRPHDESLGLLRRRVRKRHLHEKDGPLDLRHEPEREPRESHQPEHDDARDHRDGRDGPLDGDLGQRHAGSPSAEGIASSSSSSSASTRDGTTM
jgi:hypothetical protein